MAQRSFDAIVIGGGPGGYVCGIRLGQLKQKVLVVEREEVGGVFGAFEDERAGAINRHSPGKCRRFGLLSAVEANGVEAHGFGSFRVE